MVSSFCKAASALWRHWANEAEEAPVVYVVRKKKESFGEDHDGILFRSPLPLPCGGRRRGGDEEDAGGGRCRCRDGSVAVAAKAASMVVAEECAAADFFPLPRIYRSTPVDLGGADNEDDGTMSVVVEVVASCDAAASASITVVHHRINAVQ